MKLQSLRLQNFKGIKDFTFSPAGKSVSVLGQNATGKSTLFDAYAWLLTAKDSLGQQAGNFELKTILDGEPMHSIEHCVEGVFEFDGGTMELKKVYAEKYTKKRGSASAELTGHVTDHYVDGVPKSQREFQDFIASITDDRTFKILSNIRHFNEVLAWQDRRGILLGVCGDVSDADVIASDTQLVKLPAIVGKKSIEDWRKVAAGDKARINKELTEIPARIDEATRSKADVGEFTKVGTEDEIKILQGELKAVQDEKRRTENGGEIAAKTKKLTEIEGQMQALANNEAQIVELVAAAQRKKIADQENIILTATNEKRGKELVLVSQPRAIEQHETELSRLRKRWSEVFHMQFEPHRENSPCPNCGALPENQIRTDSVKALEHFNEVKSRTLTENQEKGKALKAEVERLKAESAELEKSIAAASETIAKAQAEIDHLKATPLNVQTSSEALNARERLLAGKEILESAISELRLGSHDAVAELDAKIKDLEAQIEAKQGTMASIKANYQADARVRELTAQQKKLAAEYEQIEAGLFLTDLFVRAKVSMLTDRINSRFPTVRFKLFDVQINGAVTEMCEAMDGGGVPYRNLNEAARIASGCEIAEVLSEHCGVWLPRWIDGCESIINVPASKGQVIKLIVSVGHEQLTVVEE